MTLSVLLSVYSQESPAFLHESLYSIWDFQSKKPSQIVLVVDGPLNKVLDRVIEQWQTKIAGVLKVVRLPGNVGLGAALNEGLKYCNYDLIARMDTDDIAMPDRFEKQVSFMRKNPQIVASSAQIEEWDFSLTKRLNIRSLPLVPDAVSEFAKRRNPLSHPVAIFRKSVVLDVGGYPPLRKAQDYALWALLLSKGHQLANHPDILLRMRTGTELLDRRGWHYFKHEYRLLQYQRDIGFLSWRMYACNVVGRFIVRTMPTVFKSYIYAKMR